MPPKLPSRKNASVDEAAVEANKLFAIAAVAVDVGGAAVAVGRVGLLGCIDEDLTATNMPLTERAGAGRGIAMGSLDRLGGSGGRVNCPVSTLPPFCLPLPVT